MGKWFQGSSFVSQILCLLRLRVKRSGEVVLYNWRECSNTSARQATGKFHHRCLEKLMIVVPLKWNNNSNVHQDGLKRFLYQFGFARNDFGPWLLEELSFYLFRGKSVFRSFYVRYHPPSLLPNYLYLSCTTPFWLQVIQVRLIPIYCCIEGQFAGQLAVSLESMLQHI